MTEPVQGEARGWAGRKEGRCGSKPLQCVTGRPRAGPTTCLRGLPRLLFSAPASVSCAAPTCLVTCLVCLNLPSTSLPSLLIHSLCSLTSLLANTPTKAVCYCLYIFICFACVCCFQVSLHFTLLFFLPHSVFLPFLSLPFSYHISSLPPYPLSSSTIFHWIGDSRGKTIA